MKKADFLIIAAAAAIVIITAFMRTDGERVCIYVNGRLYKSAPLGKDAVYAIETEYGKNTVRVENGAVRVTDADCPDRLCERMSAKKSGQSIVCLPHRLSITVEGKKETDVDI